MSVTRPATLDRLMRPIHHWVWADQDRRLRKLMTFADVETDGGRDIVRAAEVTTDPLLRRLYLEHAIDELRHGDLFRARGQTLWRARGGGRRVLLSGNPLPGGHGLDDLKIDGQPDHRLLAFLHIAEKSAAGRFTIYRELVDDDPQTRAIFEEILHDEVFHMNYTYSQLTRISPQTYRHHVWHARAKRIWNRYLRVAAALAAVVGNLMLTVVYFVVLPPFAWLAKRSARRETDGWTPIPQARQRAPARSQY